MGRISLGCVGERALESLQFLLDFQGDAEEMSKVSDEENKLQ